MPKMTTEQFLSHLGIEVGKPFKASSHRNECIVERCDSFCYRSNGFEYELSYLLNQEIILLPKYTLTEDEKGYVKITTAYNIGRNYENELFGINDKGDVYNLGIDNSLFPTIEKGLIILVDELRKCL